MAEPEDRKIDVKFFTRLIAFVPEGDMTLIVLKGHLLIEEQLISLIEQKLKHPTAIKQFQFFHRYCLAKAMYYEPENDSIWRSLKILNNLRNHMSHDLEAAQLKTKAKEFIDSLEGFDLIADLTDSDEERMRQALVFMCGRLDSLKA